MGGRLEGLETALRRYKAQTVPALKIDEYAEQVYRANLLLPTNLD